MILAWYIYGYLCLQTKFQIQALALIVWNQQNWDLSNFPQSHLSEYKLFIVWPWKIDGKTMWKIEWLIRTYETCDICSLYIFTPLWKCAGKCKTVRHYSYYVSVTTLFNYRPNKQYNYLYNKFLFKSQIWTSWAKWMWKNHFAEMYCGKTASGFRKCDSPWEQAGNQGAWSSWKFSGIHASSKLLKFQMET